MFIQQLSSNPQFFFAVLIVVVISVCLHELAHGIVAIWLGDDTPIVSGHMTLNPLVHMGPMSLIALLLVGIAWGAMPVDPTRQRGKYSQALVAAAGPFCNVLIALFALTALGLWLRFGSYDPENNVHENGRVLLTVFGLANIHLALFNLIPLPPLDGSRILSNFSRAFERTIDRLITSPGVYLQLSLLIFAIGGALLQPIAYEAAYRYLDLIMRLTRG